MTRVHILIYRYTPMLTGTWLISRTCNQGAWISPYRSGNQHQNFLGFSKRPQRWWIFAETVRGCQFLKKFPSVLYREDYFSIIEGTQESLARLGLDYHDVDIILAHRHGHSGTDYELAVVVHEFLDHFRDIDLLLSYPSNYFIRQSRRRSYSSHRDC